MQEGSIKGRVVPELVTTNTYTPPQLQSVTSLMRHEPVLAALRQMSGRDFGFDRQAWAKWWNATGRRQFDDSEDFPPANQRPVKQAGPAPRDTTSAPAGSEKN